jgi:hypothetical protein
MITFPKKERGGIGLGNQESVHIFRDPPKSIHTRKKERINEGDVTYMTRENQDRISDNIMQFARGVNPMVSVSYNTHGGGGAKLSSTLIQPQAHNSYKVDKKFIPPIFRQEDLLPLSRQKRDLTTVQTKASSPYLYSSNNNEYSIDYEPIKKVIHINPMYNSTSGEQYQFGGNVVLNAKRELYNIQSNLVVPTNIYNLHPQEELQLASKTSAGHITTYKSPPNIYTRQPQEELQLASKTSAGHITTYKSPPITITQFAEQELKLPTRTLTGPVTPYNSAPIIINTHPDNQNVQNGIIIRPSVSVSTNVGVKQTISVTDLHNHQVTREIIDQPIRSYLSPTFNVAFYDPLTTQYREIELPQNIKEQITVDLAKNAPIQLFNQGDGGLIKLKDYEWSIHNTPIGNSTLIIESQDRPEIYLTKNTPTYSVTAQMESKLRLNPDVNAPILENNRPIVSINSLPNSINFTDNLSREYKLPPSLSVGGFANHGVNPSMYSTQNYNPTTYSKNQSNKDYIREQIKNL